MTVKSYFSSDYREAREKFLKACSASAIKVESHQNPQMGPHGEKLYTDVALLGRREASKVLILCSGTHGVEGFCGSGIQTGLICEGLLSRLNVDQRVVVIHAINPYGFAHLRRTNEDNVDLNRNFVIHSVSHPDNRNYDVLAGAIAPKTYWPIASGLSLVRLWLYQVTRGKVALQAAISSGQYAHPQGLFYGGQFAVWSNITFHEILDRHVSDAARVAFVDFHTGLGPYGYGEIITNTLPGSPALERALEWWGERVKTTKDGGAASADLDGSIKFALSECLPRAQLTAVSLEFGTYSAFAVFRALQAENWLHHQAGLDHHRAAKIKARMQRIFYPDEDGWKRLVYRQANEVVDSALTGLNRVVVDGC
jgi:predicted deacylase